MTVTKMMLGLALTASLAACGGAQDPDAGALHEETSAALTANADLRPGVMPALVKFREWSPDRPFVPSFRVSSHFVSSVARSPDDPAHFRAYGTDGRTGVIFFQIDGTYEGDFASFLSIVSKEIAAEGLAAQGLGLSYTYGGTGDLHVPLPTGPGPQGVPQVLVQRVVNLARQVQDAIRRSVQGQRE